MSKTYNASKFKHLYFLGDTHDILGVSFVLDNIEKNSAIIQLGDFGIGFSSIVRDNAFLFKLNDELRKKKCKLFVIRGNHDNPAYFKDTNDRLDIVKLSNIVLLMDYSVVKWGKEKVLCIGGGISLDRTRRTINRSYWADEDVVFSKREISNKLRSGKITIVASHQMPTRIYDNEEFGTDLMGYASTDSTLATDTYYSRLQMEKVLECLEKKNSKPHTFVYGHYHRNKSDTKDNIRFYGLNIDEIMEKL